jgi:hypothetical protein
VDRQCARRATEAGAREALATLLLMLLLMQVQVLMLLMMLILQFPKRTCPLPVLRQQQRLLRQG